MKQCIEELHRQVWSRFIRMPYGHVLDYADANGNTTIPTQQECNRCMPNVLGWWTPIENGAFFTGLYVAGLINAWNINPTEKLRQEIDTLIKGLFLLQDIGKVDGFIARGVADDGVSHYPFGSEDQSGPWIYGLWSVRCSKFADDTLRTEIDTRIMRTINGIKAANWNIPTEWENQTRGSYAHADWRGACKLLFCSGIAYQITGSKESELLYDALIHEKPDGGLFSRLDILSHGFAPDMVRNTSLIQFWIDVCAQLMLHALITMDTDSLHQRKFMQGLYHNGVTVLPFISDYQKYDNDNQDSFDMNWRKLEPTWKFITDGDQAVNHALHQGGIWVNSIVPRRHMEHDQLGNALFANWIAQYSGDKSISQQAQKQLIDMIKYIRWETLHLSYAFIAESVCYASMQNLSDTF